MSRKSKANINEILLEAHRKGVEQAIDLSIRTGTPSSNEKWKDRRDQAEIQVCSCTYQTKSC